MALVSHPITLQRYSLNNRNAMNIPELSAKNQIKGRIRQIHSNDVISEVELDTPAGVVTSVIPTSSLRSLGLTVGQEAVAVVKTTQFALV
jgi:molybdopterin-binding protein